LHRYVEDAAEKLRKSMAAKNAKEERELQKLQEAERIRRGSAR
jgi:hypothetical protein